MTSKPIRPNLIITGFMGSGKTAVGSAVAERLGREFVDMDRLIENRVGLAVPEIFSRHGEPFFREKEADLVGELAESSGMVIATGGGTLVSDANRERFARGGVIVNLSCAAEVILKRLEHEHHRPLLEGEDRLGAIVRILESRRAQYDRIAWQIDTTSLSVDEVAGRIVKGYVGSDGDAEPSVFLRGNDGFLPTSGEILRFAQDDMGGQDDTGFRAGSDSITVDWPLGAYEVIFGRGLIADLGTLLRRRGFDGHVALAAAPIVAALYGGKLDESLRSAGFAVSHVEVPDGEIHKNLDTVSQLYDRFVDADVDRSSTIITFGGGVLSDMVGFAAATFMRGVPLVHIPTTLLAQVDASVGGKVAVDHPRGKNLIGAFFAPRLVLIDPLVLRSLPTGEARSGAAEIVKTAMIRSTGLFQRIEESGMEPTDDAIWDAIRIKADIAGRDPFEKGERAILNFGHTVGHAIETVSDYRIRHGEAVSVGMVAATKIAVELGLCDPAVLKRLGALLIKLSLPTTAEGLSVEAVWQVMSMDKKKRGGKLRYVLPSEVGKVVVTSDVPEEVVHRVLREVVLADQS